MRDSSTLNEALKKAMGGESPPIEMKFSDFARTELMLHALWTHFPDQPIRKAHLLMQGYREPGTTDAQWDILKHLRHLAAEFRSSIDISENYESFAVASL